MPSSTSSPAERAIAAAIYAPIGLGAQLVDDVPAVVAKARQHVVLARFIGKMAVDQGVREVRARLGGLTDPASPVVVDEPVDPAPPSADRSAAAAGAPDADSLALPDYDQLPAAHIVGKLTGLTATELDAIEVYELAHRHRRTVLGRITQLRVD